MKTAKVLIAVIAVLGSQLAADTPAPRRRPHVTEHEQLCKMLGLERENRYYMNIPGKTAGLYRVVSLGERGWIRVRIDNNDNRFKPFWANLQQVSFIAETNAEQDGADQPATALESEAEGNEEPKPESEVRPQ